MESVDFTNALGETRYDINKWIENETNGECDTQFIYKICQLYMNLENCPL